MARLEAGAAAISQAAAARRCGVDVVEAVALVVPAEPMRPGNLAQCLVDQDDLGGGGQLQQLGGRQAGQAFAGHLEVRAQGVDLFGRRWALLGKLRAGAARFATAKVSPGLSACGTENAGASAGPLAGLVRVDVLRGHAESVELDHGCSDVVRALLQRL